MFVGFWSFYFIDVFDKTIKKHKILPIKNAIKHIIKQVDKKALYQYY